MKRVIGLLSVCSALLLSFSEDEPKVKVISVIDGNTVEVLSNNGDKQKIFLHGVDSPDSGQNFAMEAKQLLENLILNKQVTVVFKSKDRYGNPLVEIVAEGIPDPRFELVRKGLAWTTDNNPELESLKEHAREQGLGLWIDENPMPPWMYRRQQSMLRPKSS